MITTQLYNRSRKTWTARWWAADGKRKSKTIGPSKGEGRLTRARADAIRRQWELDLNTSGKLEQDRPEQMTLAGCAAHYLVRRRQENGSRGFLRTAPKLTESTIKAHDMVLRYLIEHFGESRLIDSIDVNGAESFVNAMAAGQLSRARGVSEESRKYNLGPQTVRKHIRTVKSIFNWAKLMRMVTANPFDDFDGKALPSDPNHYVSLDDFEKLLDAAPTIGWKVLYALCRFAGLRRGEARSLLWAGEAIDKHGARHWIGVDFQSRRICLVAEKTRMYREVPISPQLAYILAEAHRGGSETVADLLSYTNLTRLMQGHVRAAGLRPWSKLYQSLRSSCENDWKEQGIAEATYSVWIGHSVKVSRANYVSPLLTEFEAVTGKTPLKLTA